MNSIVESSQILLHPNEVSFSVTSALQLEGLKVPAPLAVRE